VDCGEEEEIKIKSGQMRGVFCNIRGVNQPGRMNSLTNLGRSKGLDFVGVIETKKENFAQMSLNKIGGSPRFIWYILPTKGIAGGILLGIKEDFVVPSNVSALEFSLNCEMKNKRDGLVWKLVVVYGAPYEEKKADFIDELHAILAVWQGPILVGVISI
jgi:hypothetical protein